MRVEIHIYHVPIYDVIQSSVFPDCKICLSNLNNLRAIRVSCRGTGSKKGSDGKEETDEENNRLKFQKLVVGRIKKVIALLVTRFSGRKISEVLFGPTKKCSYGKECP